MIAQSVGFMGPVFSSAFVIPLVVGVITDPPEHTKLRKVVASTFSQRAVAVYEHFITGLTEEVLDRLPAPARPSTSSTRWPRRSRSGCRGGRRPAQRDRPG